jgi:hypothetical protein
MIDGFLSLSHRYMAYLNKASEPHTPQVHRKLSARVSYDL